MGVEVEKRDAAGAAGAVVHDWSRGERCVGKRSGLQSYVVLWAGFLFQHHAVGADLSGAISARKISLIGVSICVHPKLIQQVCGVT